MEEDHIIRMKRPGGKRGAELMRRKDSHTLPAGRAMDVGTAAGGRLPLSTRAGDQLAGTRRTPDRRKPRSMRPGAGLEPVFFRLTPAEMRVAGLIKHDKSNKEIAGILGISIRTAEVHRNHIRQKLGLTRKSVSLKNHLQAMDATMTEA